MAIRRGWRPLTGRAPDQGLRLADSPEMASRNATGVFAGSGEPSDCQRSLQGSKSLVGNITASLTKTQSNDGCDGRLARPDWGGAVFIPSVTLSYVMAYFPRG